MKGKQKRTIDLNVYLVDKKHYLPANEWLGLNKINIEYKQSFSIILEYFFVDELADCEIKKHTKKDYVVGSLGGYLQTCSWWVPGVSFNKRPNNHLGWGYWADHIADLSLFQSSLDTADLLLPFVRRLFQCRLARHVQPRLRTLDTPIDRSALGPSLHCTHRAHKHTHTLD